MINKINKELEVFVDTIKEPKGCDKMLDYINSSIYSSIKLLMFSSKTFSIISRVLFFLIISVAGLLMLTSIGAIILNISYLFVSFLVLLVFILIYVVYFKKSLFLKIVHQKEKFN